MSDVELERRLTAALRAPVAGSEGARDRIMHGVRSAARTGGPRRRTPSPSHGSTRHSILGLAMAAGIGSMAVLSAITPHSAPGDDARASAIDDSIAAALRDTLRLTRLIRDGDHRYAFVVDGARWTPDPGITPVRPGDRLAPLLRVARDSN